MKCKIPPFPREGNSDSYIDWEMKVKQNLECFDYDESTKVSMRKAPTKSWDELKKELRERFVPLFYTRYLYNKLQRLYLGSKSIEEYLKEMNVAIIKAHVVESQEATMARFLHDLNKEL
ncbi:hypothetical protein CR513_38709, partial [Mucuna pruriens]